MSVRCCGQGGVPFAAPLPLPGSAWQSNREPVSPDRGQGGVPMAAPPPLLGSAWQSNREPVSTERGQEGAPMAAPPPVLDRARQSSRKPVSTDLRDTMKDPSPESAIVADSAQAAVAPIVQGPLLRSIGGPETDAHPQAARTIRTPR